MCRMRESRSWGSELLLSRESLSPLPPTFMKHGQSCYWNVGWTGGTPPWCGVLWTVLTWGFPTSGACTCHSTMPQSKHSLMYIVVLSIVSSKQAVTLALGPFQMSPLSLVSKSLKPGTLLCFLSSHPTTYRYVELSSFLSPPSSHKGLCAFTIQSC